MLKNLRNKKKKGFTLIELIIVIAIIAILAAIAIPKFGDVRRNAALKSDIANAKVIADATSALIAEGTIAIPSTNTPLIISESNTDATAGKIEGYLQNIPTPKSSGYTQYELTITNQGNVSVSMSKNGSNAYPLYPNASTATP